MWINVGQRVEALETVGPVGAGSVGRVTNVDNYPGEEYPYVVTYPGGTSAAYSRHELRVIEEGE